MARMKCASPGKGRVVTTANGTVNGSPNSREMPINTGTTRRKAKWRRALYRITLSYYFVKSAERHINLIKLRGVVKVVGVEEIPCCEATCKLSVRLTVEYAAKGNGPSDIVRAVRMPDRDEPGGYRVLSRDVTPAEVIEC